MDDEYFTKIVKDNNTYSGVCKAMNWPINGQYSKKVRMHLKRLNLDGSHFRYITPQKYQRLEKECPICGKTFIVINNPDAVQKTTCSYSCSNSYFRSGLNNPNVSNYRTICKLYHGSKCIVCNETKLIETHHVDRNHLNNDPSNLIPLCPTHHQYYHSRYRSEVEPIISSYIEEWKKNR